VFEVPLDENWAAAGEVVVEEGHERKRGEVAGL
jgi:hypothetical protein